VAAALAAYAVIPVKNLADSKRRLSQVLSPQERRELTLAMLEDVLAAVKASAVNAAVVTGEDAEVEAAAKRFGADYLPANGLRLNPAIDAAAAWCLVQNATSVLVVPADIPLLTGKNVDRILDLGGHGGEAVVLSPSQNWGTNAIYQNPAGLVRACFGTKSFVRHIQKALGRLASARLYFSAETALDIDSASDLKKLFNAKSQTVSKRSLQEIAAKNRTTRDFLLRN
jgi:2-phospho-L-lactate/phosphoenolpyruvate guanylyltransferase